MTCSRLSASARTNYGLPLLVPACLLAAPAASALSSRVDAWGDWIARALFGVLAAFVWVVWIAMMALGAPPGWSLLARDLPLDFTPSLSPTAFIAALGLSLLAIALAWSLPTFRGRALISWVAGAALCWGLVSTLWLPWLDYAKSYRSVFMSMRVALPDDWRCVSSFGLGETERAMLRYFLGINTQRQEVAPWNCDLLLVNGLATRPPHHIDRTCWRKIWEDARPGDRRERFWLFAAIPSSNRGAATTRAKLALTGSNDSTPALRVRHPLTGLNRCARDVVTSQSSSDPD